MSDVAYATNDNSTNAPQVAEAFVLPASFAQRRLWFIDQMAPGSPAYNVPSAFRISGELDPGFLGNALNEIVSRHEGLRTTFRLVDDEPSQVIAPALRIRLPIVDLRTLRVEDRERELAELISREARAPFDLAAGPLIRATLVQIAEADHALLLTLHHIITDTWSQDILMRELTIAYDALRKGDAPALPELPIQYADFANWQREQLHGEVLDRSLTYWKRELEGLSLLELPAARRRPARPSYRGKALPIELPEPLTAALKRLAARENVSLFMLMLAAWKTQLFRYTSQTDVSVGSPISNRSRAEVEPLIGFFLNTLVLRTDLSGGPTFRELLQRVRTKVLGAFEHQEMPFEMLVETLQPVRVAGQNPLFNVAFALVHGDAKVWSLDGVTFTPIRIEDTNAKFDLTIGLDESDGRIGGTLIFNAELFDEAFIARLIAHFRTLLEGITANPDLPIDSLPMLESDERERLVTEWNRTERSFPADRTVAALFEEQAARQPDAVALESGERRIRYGELNHRANQLARHLRNLGVSRGACVGVCMERSPELIECILAVVKAGGVYVPLDAASPPERLALMLEESASGVVIVRSDAVADLGKTRARVVDFDGVDLSQYDTTNPGLEGAGGDPAYVIFTSGSTGKPKGVVVPHRAITRLVLNTDYAQLTSDDVVAHVSNVAFDAATFEIWGALLNGATLTVVPHDLLLSARSFAAFLADRRITALFLTTALFNEIARQTPTAFRPLKHLLFGGEACNPDCVRRVLDHGAPQRLVNAYGPTETTTFASWQLVRDVPADAVTVPIGQPIANTTLHILDARLQPVPSGVIGQIFIGGPGVALGYVNDPELTAQRFLETPFGRLYKTGDLGRRRADGAIEFCGRIDSQVKLRGFRIEPGEIEAALQQHPHVRHAAVVAHREADAAHSLVGYLVPASSERTVAADLREFLSHRLPACMIPSAFVWIDALPLTPNGKLDARKLPPPDAATVASSGSRVAPRNEVERGISALWGEVLGRDHLSLDDDFFLVGGHSIMAILLLDRMREKFGVDVPVQRLFETPTIRGLSEFVAARLPASKQFKSIVMIQRGDESREPLFLVPGGWGGEVEFLVYGQLARQLDPALPLYGLRTRDSNAEVLPEKTVEQFAATFVEEICAFRPEGPYLLGGECVGGIIAYEMARQLREAGKEVALVLLLGTEWPNRRSLDEFEAWERKRRREQIWETKIRGPVVSHLRKLRGLPIGGKVNYLWTRLRRGTVRLARTPVSTEREVLTEYPRRLMAHQPKQHDARVTLVIDEQSQARVASLGWDKRHPGQLEVHVAAGDHISYIRDHAAATAAILRSIIDRARHATPC